MREIDIQELQQNASHVIARAEAGESITVTDRGRPVALLGPIKLSRLDAMVEAGLATPPVRDIKDLPPPATRAAGQQPLSEIIDEQRTDRI